MERPRVFVTRRIPDNGLQRLREHADVDVWPETLPPPRDELLKRIAGCSGVLTMLSDRVDAEFLDAAGPQLKVIGNFAVGINNIDLEEAWSRGIAIGNTPDVLTDATADIAVLLLLAAARRAKEAMNQVAAGQWRTWEPTGLLGADVVGRTLGVVGMGRIGAATASRLVGGWGMKLLYCSRSRKPDVDARWNAKRVSLDELLGESDFVSIHTDLNSETEGLFGADAFNKMKSGAVIVNTSRGGVVDQDALVEALRSGRIRAAGLDVTTPEPLPSDSPLVELPNCVVLPHLGSASERSRAAMAEIAADNIVAGIRDRPLRCAVE
jgi:glyoxylate reductase